MPPPELSVIVPCKLAGASGVETRGAMLRLCLAALSCQTASDDAFEVIVVDDGSDVAVDCFLAAHAAESTSLRPRVVRNPGPSHGQEAAYNYGVAQARGRIVLLTTDDSILAPDAVSCHIARHAQRGRAAYLCGVERQYVYGVLFRNIITGDLHPRGDLAVRSFGSLLGFADLRRTAEQLGFTGWKVTADTVRHRFPELYRMSAATPGFEDMYRELESARSDLDWLAVRMGNHSIPRSALLELGGLDAAVVGGNSDQDLGLRIQQAGLDIALIRDARSVLLEHRRDLRSFAGDGGLAVLAERWPRKDVAQLRAYFSLGYERSISAYRRFLETSH